MTKNLKQLTDDALIFQVKSLVTYERSVLVQILHRLREIEDRQLFLRYACPSLFEFCVRELRYSESAAMRRISAMRLMREFPEVAGKLESGLLNLCNVAQVSMFIKRETKLRREEDSLAQRHDGPFFARGEKKEILSKVENVSKRECEKILFQFSPEAAVPTERARRVSDDITRIEFGAPSRATDKFDRIRSLYSHTHPELSYLELFELMADEILKRKDPALRKTRRSPPPVEVKVGADSVKHEGTVGRTDVAKGRVGTPAGEAAGNKNNGPGTSPLRPGAKNSVPIPSAIRTAVWKRDGGCCVHRDDRTGRICGSTHQLEIDHRVPRLMGGTNEVENLELVCRRHNILRAGDILGAKVMDPFRRAGPTAM